MLPYHVGYAYAPVVSNVIAGSISLLSGFWHLMMYVSSNYATPFIYSV